MYIKALPAPESVMSLNNIYKPNMSKNKINIKSLKVIDKIESIRKKNNVNWMNILRLAFKHAPVEASNIMSKIYRDDAKITTLVKKLSNK